jgi:hypothetical protein
MVTVLVKDDVRFSKATQWALDNCESFEKVEIIDISDIDVYNDELARYSFRDVNDAAWFNLTWGGEFE